MIYIVILFFFAFSHGRHLPQNIHIDGSMQERRNSNALALELGLSCTNPSICSTTLSPRGKEHWKLYTGISIGILWMHALVTLHFFVCAKTHQHSMIYIVILLFFAIPTVDVLTRNKHFNGIGLCTKDVTPLLTHWSYVFLALTHRFVPQHRPHVGKLMLWIIHEQSNEC